MFSSEKWDFIQLAHLVGGVLSGGGFVCWGFVRVWFYPRSHILHQPFTHASLCKITKQTNDETSDI